MIFTRQVPHFRPKFASIAYHRTWGSHLSLLLSIIYEAKTLHYETVTGGNYLCYRNQPHAGQSSLNYLPYFFPWPYFGSLSRGGAHTLLLNSKRGLPSERHGITAFRFSPLWEYSGVFIPSFQVHGGCPG